MPSPSNPSRGAGTFASAYRRPFRYGNSDMRVSDAERSDVADQLSKHYSDGRLDQAEFNERLERAMNAKTRADFHGLFTDLPDEPAEPAPGAQRAAAIIRPRRRYPLPRILFLALVVVIAAVATRPLLHSVFPWLLIAVVAFLWLHDGRRRHRRF
ncbi:MAG TPA: DUF1707 domain-containing protein [Streptosporangiaceae bacterium]|nr:DUF1707 domain-containing protein [Streptosporangiaceae bacterium]